MRLYASKTITGAIIRHDTPNERVIAMEVFDESEKALIVKAVNERDSLIAALRDVLEIHGLHASDPADNPRLEAAAKVLEEAQS